MDLQGCIGSDGLWIKQLLEEGGVGVDRLKEVEGEVTGRAIIQSAADGENSIGKSPRSHYGERREWTDEVVLHKGANFHIQEEDVKPDLSDYTHLLLQNEIPLSTTLANIQSNRDIVSIFNPSPMLSPDELAAFPWAYLSWLIVNEGELQTLLQALSSAPFHPSNDLLTDAERRIKALHGSEKFHKGVSIICTLGSKGILYFQPGKEIGTLPAAEARRVRDTTGAGDCFAGYFAAGLMRRQKGEEDLEEVLKICLTVSLPEKMMWKDFLGSETHDLESANG